MTPKGRFWPNLTFLLEERIKILKKEKNKYNKKKNLVSWGPSWRPSWRQTLPRLCLNELCKNNNTFYHGPQFLVTKKGNKNVLSSSWSLALAVLLLLQCSVSKNKKRQRVMFQLFANPPTISDNCSGKKLWADTSRESCKIKRCKVLQQKSLLTGHYPVH